MRVEVGVALIEFRQRAPCITVKAAVLEEPDILAYFEMRLCKIPIEDTLNLVRSGNGRFPVTFAYFFSGDSQKETQRTHQGFPMPEYLPSPLIINP